MEALVQYSVWPGEVEAAEKQTDDEGVYKEALKFKSPRAAFGTLEKQVAALLEANWQKIKEGS